VTPYQPRSVLYVFAFIAAMSDAITREWIVIEMAQICAFKSRREWT
jgi:hypothetical protein